MSSLRLILAWVCDPAFGRDRLPPRDEDARYWNTLEACFEKALSLRERAQGEAGMSVRFTWVVRCDNHIASLHADPAWCLRRFSAALSSLQAQGDSMGWIFYPAMQEGRGWTQIYADGTRPTELMTECCGAYKTAWNLPDALLMGWHGHTLATMRQAAELGIAVDLSAIPGRYTIKRAGLVPPVNACDWEITPNAPYYPSVVDYRRPVVYPHEPVQNILELPWTLGPADWRCLQKSLEDLLRPGNLGLRRNYRRYRRGMPVRIGVSLNEFKKLAAPTLEKAERGGATLTILTQVSELASRFRSDALPANLFWLAEESSRRGISFDCLAAHELRETLTPGDFSKPILAEQHGAPESAHQH